MNLNQVTLPALDVAASVAFYRGMGFVQIVDSAHYARFQCPAGDARFSVHAVDSAPLRAGVVVYFECEKLDQQVNALEAAGYEFSTRPSDERWLARGTADRSDGQRAVPVPRRRQSQASAVADVGAMIGMRA